MSVEKKIQKLVTESKKGNYDALLKIRLEVGQDPNFLSADIYRIPTACIKMRHSKLA